MTRKSRRLALIAAALAVIGCAVGLGLYAMKDSLALFLTPAEIAAKKVQPGTRLRVGGLVEDGSVVRADDRLTFNVTDGTKTVGVDCRGECFANMPDLFREGQGVVVEGVLGRAAGSAGDQILAKHDERYMPREVVESLKKQGALAGRSERQVIVEIGHYALVLALAAALAQTVDPRLGRARRRRRPDGGRTQRGADRSSPASRSPSPRSSTRTSSPTSPSSTSRRIRTAPRRRSTRSPASGGTTKARCCSGC